jgi:hypothetical protein
VLKQIETRIQDNHLITAGGLHISFERTLKMPEDGKGYPLPPSLGAFPIYKIADFVDSVPKEWREKGGYFIPMFQSEAMWFNFSGATSALIVNIGDENALTRNGKSTKLEREEQNYIVAPSQPWLDGFNSEDGLLRQFMARPLGQQKQIEQLPTEKEWTGAGVNFVVYSANPGLLSEDDEEMNYSKFSDCMILDSNTDGGKMTQEIYPDPHGFDTWDLDSRIEINIYFANSDMFKKITGEAPPSSPITEEVYEEHGYPWFDKYKEN